MKRFASVFLCLVLVCFGLVSCGKKIEMEESKIYHFEGYDLSFAVPKGWTVEQETKDFEKGPASGLFVKGITLKDGVSYNLTSFYIYEPNFIANHPFIPDFDEKKSTKFGNNYLYIPKIDSSTNTKRALFLAVENATDAEIESLRAYWDGVMAEAPGMSIGDLLLADEEFHRRLTAMSHNKELSQFLEQVTRRIHVARHIDLEQSDWNTRAFNAHAQLLDLLQARQLEPALQALSEHIDLSLKRAVQITKEMVAKFFLQDQSWSSSQAPGQ